MINLLPPAFQKRKRSEERFRLILLLGVAAGVGLLALSLFLLVIEASLGAERSVQEARVEDFEKKAAKEDSVLAEIKNWNSKLHNTEKFKEQRRDVSSVLSQIGSSLPPELHLLSFSYTPSFETRKKDEVIFTPAIVSITGKAPTREQLLSFKDALQEDPFFAEVTFPPSNWVTPKDITFSFQAKLSEVP